MHRPDYEIKDSINEFPWVGPRRNTGGSPEYIEKNWDNLVGIAYNLAKLKAESK
jgi:hypothetical protein